MVKWEKIFKMFGFTDSASKLYMSALSMGPSSVQDLAKKIDVSRMTAYTVIELLMKEGLMSTVQKGKKTLYVAESPERLQTFMHNRIKQMENTIDTMDDAITELKLLQRGDKPSVRMFEGREGIETILNDVVQSGAKQIFEIGNVDMVKTMFSDEELNAFKQQLTKRGIQGTAIYSSKDPEIKPRKSAQLKLIKDKDISFAGDILIYDNKVAFMTFRGKVVNVLIESAEIAQTMREVFRMSWESELLERTIKKYE